MKNKDNMTNGEIAIKAKMENDIFASDASKEVSSIMNARGLLIEHNITFFNDSSEFKQGFESICDVAQKLMMDKFDMCFNDTYMHEILNIACLSSAKSGAINMLKLIEKTGVDITDTKFKSMVNEAVFEER